MIQIVMSWEEIKRRLKEETPMQIIADLNGVDVETMKKIIQKLEKEHGEKVLPPAKRGRPRTNNPKRSTQYRRKKEEQALLAPEKPSKKHKCLESTFRLLDNQLITLEEQKAKLYEQVDLIEDQIKDIETVIQMLEVKT